MAVSTRLLSTHACMAMPVHIPDAHRVRWATAGAGGRVTAVGQAERCSEVFACSAANEQAGAVSLAGLRRTVACRRRGRGRAPPRGLRLGGALQQRCQLPSARLRAHPGGRRNTELLSMQGSAGSQQANETRSGGVQRAVSMAEAAHSRPGPMHGLSSRMRNAGSHCSHARLISTGGARQG